MFLFIYFYFYCHVYVHTVHTPSGVIAITISIYSSRLVCMYVSHAHAILAVRAIKSVTKDTVVLNVRFAAIL